MKKLALFLSLVMTLSAFPAITVEAHNGYDDQVQFSEAQIDEHEQNQIDVALPDHFEQSEIFERSNNLRSELTISEARYNYNLLRVGNYTSAEVVSRFQELFGYMLPDYILQNYTRIFDITSAEMDEVILAGYRG